MSYAMVINFDLDGLNRSIVLDAVDETKVTATSDIASHPMVSGDIIADHTIKQPIGLDFSGKFSTKSAETIVVSSDGARLADVEDFFERIKNESILCTLIKVKVDESTSNDDFLKNARFSVRRNMILHSITWTEEITTLGYSFSWTQVMLVDVEEFDVDIDDNFLPYITNPETKNFTDVLFDQEEFDRRVIEFCRSSKIATANFLDFLQSCGASLLVGLGIGLVLAIALVTCLSVPVYGALIAAAVVVVGCLIYGLVKCFKRIDARLKYKIKPFDVGKNQKKNEQEVKRFADFLESLHNKMSDFNNHITVYQIAENKQQECLLTIGSNYYVFSILKNNTNEKWGVIATDMDDTIKGQMPDITAALNAVSDCTLQNCLFKTTDGYYIYVMKPDDEADENDLTNYYLMCSSIDLSKWSDIVTSILEDAILK